jgi:hypothetical protein
VATGVFEESSASACHRAKGRARLAVRHPLVSRTTTREEDGHLPAPAHPRAQASLLRAPQ